MAMATAHVPTGAPHSGVSRPVTLLIALPSELVQVVDRREFMNVLKGKSLIKSVKCVQSMPNGVFRVSCKSIQTYTWLSTNGLAIRGFQCSVMEAQPSYTVVRLFRCPFEIPDETMSVYLSPFGKILQIKHETDHDFPSVLTGTRILHMQLSSPIPSRVMVKRFPCNVWYRGQPKTCRICHGKDHEAPACPLKGKCLRCLEEGHTARNCENAWKVLTPDGPVVPPPVTDPPAPVPAPVDTSASPVAASAPHAGAEADSPVDTSVPHADPEAASPGAAPAPPADPEVASPVDSEAPSVAASVPAVSDPILASDTPAPSEFQDVVMESPPEDPVTFGPSDSMFIDPSPSYSTDASSPSLPLVDKEGFIRVQSRRSRRRAARLTKERSRSASTSRSRSASSTRSRSRSPSNP